MIEANRGKAIISGAASAEPVFRARGLTKIYRMGEVEVPALLQVDLDLYGGEFGTPWLPAAVGFLLGAAAMWGLDRSLPHLHPGFPPRRAEGPRTSWQRAVLLVLAITLHNIPEGLAIGVAFAGASAGLASSTLGAAVALTLGIAIQNIPEGWGSRLPRPALVRLRSPESTDPSPLRFRASRPSLPPPSSRAACSNPEIR